MCSPKRLLMLTVAVLALSSCQRIPDDVSELIGSKQTASLWVAPGERFELSGTPSAQSFASHSTVTIEYENEDKWSWTSQPSIRIDSKTGSARVGLSKDLLTSPGTLVPSAETGQDYGIRLFRTLKPTRQWVSRRSVNRPIHVTGGVKGAMVQKLSGSSTEHFDDHYMDGDIEYRLAFYDRESTLVAVIYIKKSVTGFLEKSVRI